MSALAHMLRMAQDREARGWEQGDDEGERIAFHWHLQARRIAAFLIEGPRA